MGKAKLNVRRRSKLKDFLMTLTLLATMALGSAWLAKQNEVSITGNYKIVDGDSLVLNGREVRLLGIDAPEYSQNCTFENGKTYACGKKSRAQLVQLLKNGKLICNGWEEDKYQRLLATCYAGELELNATMVQQGWALSYGAYEGEEAKAKQQSLGVWQGGFDKPSSWRENQRDSHSVNWISKLLPW